MSSTRTDIAVTRFAFFISDPFDELWEQTRGKELGLTGDDDDEESPDY